MQKMDKFLSQKEVIGLLLH